MEQLKDNLAQTDTILGVDEVFEEILLGLNKHQKELPAKLFYDQEGSELFDQICQLDEYYPTRTETAIMEENIEEIAEMVRSHRMLIEYGSGSSIKTRILLDQLRDLAVYVPVDISRDHLYSTAGHLRKIYTDLEIIPLWADYTAEFELPWITINDYKKLAYFPGSTIGNFYPHEVIRFMKNLSKVVGVGGGFLVGVDLQKNPEVINRAYNDSKGITAAFNLNILTHMNREYGANFNEKNYRHYAYYNESAGRIEMHLISLKDQRVIIGWEEILFHSGESILTEVSYKYSLEGFSQLASRAGFEVQKVWTDPQKFFSVQYLVVKEEKNK